MATRSSIHSINGETLTSVYCHWDGYPSHHAPILLEHINTPEKVIELLSFGNISSLNENTIPTKEHKFDHPQQGVTVFYGRDRGETDQEAIISTVNVDENGLPALSALPIYEDYQYLYDLCNNTWYMMVGYSIWVKLTTEHYEK